jgi:hypothetical protein
MTSLGFAVCVVVGPIGIGLPYKVIGNANADSIANAIAIEMYLAIGFRFEILKNSRGRSHMAGEWLQIVTRKSSNCI